MSTSEQWTIWILFIAEDQNNRKINSVGAPRQSKAAKNK